MSSMKYVIGVTRPCVTYLVTVEAIHDLQESDNQQQMKTRFSREECSQSGKMLTTRVRKTQDLF